MAEDTFSITALEPEIEERDDNEEEEEAPSLSDLPLTCAGEEHSNDRRRSMSEPADFFEFMMPNLNCSSYTFSWNDLVWPSVSSTTGDEDLLISSPHQSPPPRSPPRRLKTRRSESFNESKISTQYSSLLKSPCFRTSRSLDYCRLRRNPSSSRSRTTRDSANCEAKSQARISPPWYWLMFGPLRLPPAAETDMRRSAKSRQIRAPATLFPAAKVSGDRRGWKLISVLSCKSHASVAVTTPFQPYC